MLVALGDDALAHQRAEAVDRPVSRLGRSPDALEVGGGGVLERRDDQVLPAAEAVLQRADGRTGLRSDVTEACGVGAPLRDHSPRGAKDVELVPAGSPCAARWPRNGMWVSHLENLLTTYNRTVS